VSYGLLNLATCQRVSELFQIQTLFGLLLFFVFTYLLYSKDSRRYFAPSALPRLHFSARRRLAACLYVLAAVFVYWSLSAIAMGLTEIFPQSVGRDKFAFIALPIIGAAEWIGRTPGALSRLGALAIAFGLFLLKMFLMRYGALYNALIPPSIWQLGNWVVGMCGVGLVLLYLARRHAR
jgi:hypothetical protein